MTQLIDMCYRSKLLTLSFELNIDKWKTINKDILQIVSAEWQSIKFLNDDGMELNEEIVNVPDDSGGVYLFLCKPDFIPGLHRYIMYIGRAQRQTTFSLQKRCRSYLKDSRPAIAMMRELWGESLYFFYLPLDDNEVIKQVEKELLRVIIPPCNSQIPYHYSDVEQPLF